MRAKLRSPTSTIRADVATIVTLVNALLAKAYTLGHQDAKIGKESRADEMKISAAQIRKLDVNT